jgi:hypothetical protein
MKHLKFAATTVAITGVLAAVATVPATAAESYLYHGTSGRRTSFFLIGGQYTLYVYAKRPLTYRSDPASQSCIFGGNFQRVWPTHEVMSLGAGITISTIVPHKIGPRPIALPAGLYALFIPTLTSCDWKFILGSTSDNPAGVAPVTMLKRYLDRVEPIETAAIGDVVQFYAQYRTAHDEKAPVSGMIQFVHDGQVVRTSPIGVGFDSDSGGNAFFLNWKWAPEDAKYLGKNTVSLSVRLGSAEFTSTGDFTLTK